VEGNGNVVFEVQPTLSWRDWGRPQDSD